jgi:DNA polymerase I-like protein with 3'-5' exonuclease and polymerase domains
MISLEEVATKYGIPFTKDKTITDAFEAGRGAETIDKQKLLLYMIKDIETTEQVAAKQMEAAIDRGVMPLMIAMMAALKASFYIEQNGMRLDIERLREMFTDLTNHMTLAESAFEGQLNFVVLDLLPTPAEKEAWDSIKKHLSNGGAGSTKLVSTLVYGGEYIFEAAIPNGVWASGEKKGKTKYAHKKMSVCFPIPPTGLDPAGDLSVSEDILERVALNSASPGPIRALCKHVLTTRVCSKAIGYLEGWMKYADRKDVVRTTFNLCVTPTGRWTSASPNFQNVPNKDSFPKIKECYVPHNFPDYLVEIDFKQLEVIGCAMQTQDAQMIKDILDGRDIHEETGKKVFGSTMTKEQRRLVKTVNFGLIYGGGIARIAEDSGLSRTLVKQIRNALLERYPGIETFRENMKDYLSHRKMYPDPSTPGAVALWEDPITHRMYKFKQYPSKFVPGTWEFSHTELCNYPIQGLATGDIVPTVIGLLDSYIVEHKLPVKIINVIHDSVLLEIGAGFTPEQEDTFRKFFGNINARLNKVFKTEEFNLPLKVTGALYTHRWGKDAIDITPWLYYTSESESLDEYVRENPAVPF